MLDKMVMKCIIDVDDAPVIINNWKLEECAKGEEVFYQSSAYAKFEGVFIYLRGCNLQIKCSIHKLWNKWNNGALDNSTDCRFSQAVETLKMLFAKMGNIDLSTVRVTYYEVGMNLRMENDPLDYIRAVTGIGEIEEREMFNDANFEKNRQKTTEKSKNYKKVMKIYDKTFEAEDKRRTCDKNVLRVETIYKRQGAHLTDFFDFSFVNKLLNRFWKDWHALTFSRMLIGAKGVRESQLSKARELINFGNKGYLELIKQRYNTGAITKRMYRDCREFARDYYKFKELFIQVESELEKEYNQKLTNGFIINRN